MTKISIKTYGTKPSLCQLNSIGDPFSLCINLGHGKFWKKNGWVEYLPFPYEKWTENNESRWPEFNHCYQSTLNEKNEWYNLEKKWFCEVSKSCNISFRPVKCFSKKQSFKNRGHLNHLEVFIFQFRPIPNKLSKKFCDILVFRATLGLFTFRRLSETLSKICSAELVVRITIFDYSNKISC